MEELLNNLFNNQTFILLISIILALYSALLAPALPNNIIYFFDSNLGKLIFLFLIGYMANKNIQVALMVSVAFVVTLTIANRNQIEESFETFINNNEEDDEEENDEEENDEDIDEDNDIDGYNNDNEMLESSILDKNDEEFEDYSVKPAHNLSGSSDEMYAPYK
jgi:hypothetical protein